MPELTLTAARRLIDCSRHSPCIEMSYDEGGAGDTLVLIHGLGANSTAWGEQLEELSSSHRVIAMDLRGHGDSGDRPDEAVTLRTLVDDLVALLRGLGIERAHVCGNSLGGMLALELWVRWPALLKSLVLADTTAFFPPPQILEEFLRLFDHMEMTTWARFMAPRLLRRGAPAGLVEEMVQMMATTSRAVYRQGLAAAFSADYRWMLPLVTVPTLILVGEEDQATPVGYARFLENHIRGAVLQVLPQAAHLPHRENPREFNRQVRWHLERLKEK